MPAAQRDLQWWTRVVVAFVTIAGSAVGVGAAVNSRPTEGAVRVIVTDAVHAHAQGWQPHAELKEIQEKLERISVDIAVIKEQVTSVRRP